MERFIRGRDRGHLRTDQRSRRLQQRIPRRRPSGGKVTFIDRKENRDVKRASPSHLLFDNFCRARMRRSRAGTTGRTRASAGGKARLSASSGGHGKGKGARGHAMGTRRARTIQMRLGTAVWRSWLTTATRPPSRPSAAGAGLTAARGKIDKAGIFPNSLIMQKTDKREQKMSQRGRVSR